MDINKFNEFRLNNLFIDLILIITDDDGNKIKLYLHKIYIKYVNHQSVICRIIYI